VIGGLVGHVSLRVVDISANGIGAMVLHPSFRGHAGATATVQHLEHLLRENSTLEELNLAWNSLSGEHVLPMMDAVSHSCACIGSPCLRYCVHGASIAGREHWAAQAEHGVERAGQRGCRAARLGAAPEQAAG
jgi:hypothetical protein